MNELKPCPFCGNEYPSLRITYVGKQRFWLKCEECGIQTRIFDTKEEAADAWNKRGTIMDNITIEELKNNCKRMIKEKLNDKHNVPTSADILNYATAIAELEKNELIKKLADTNAGVFGATSPIEAQLMCNEEVK